MTFLLPFWTTTLFFLILPRESTPLRCFTCINYICPEKNTYENCTWMEKAAIYSASKYLKIRQGRLPPKCPDPEDFNTWENFQLIAKDLECERTSKSCSITRFEVRSYDLQNKKKISKSVAYGTVMGCSTRERQNLVKTRCEIEHFGYSRPSGGPSHSATVGQNHSILDRVKTENCYTRPTCPGCDSCFHDFCTNITWALPRRFREESEVTTVTWVWTMLALQILLVAVFCADK